MTDGERAAMAQLYHRLYTSEDGRRVLDDLRRSFGDRRSFVDGDALATAFREGQRDVYLATLDLIAAGKDPARARMTIVTQDDDPPDEAG